MNFFQRLWFSLETIWVLIKLDFELISGIWKISRMKGPIVSIFGGSRFNLSDPYAQMASKLAQIFVQHGISVMTGGGPGIMEAASCGAIAIGKKGVVSLGIGVTELGEGRNPCVQEYLELDNFAARKWLLTHYSVGFIIFPGGFGTLDELAEVLTLVQIKRLPRVPIILIGKEYWHYFMDWITAEAMSHGLIPMESISLFSVTDDLNEAYQLINQHLMRTNQTKQEKVH